MPKAAVGVAVYTDPDTPPSEPDFFLRHVETHDARIVSAADIPHFERNQRAIEGAVMPTTMHGTLELNLRVDVRQFPRLCLAGGKYTFVGGLHTIVFGDDASAFLAFWLYEGNPLEMWFLERYLLNQLEFTTEYTAGTSKAKLGLVGLPKQVITTGLPTIAFVTPASSILPFTARQSLLLRADAAFCPITSTISIDNHVEPNYCGPSIELAADADPYQLPDTIDQNEVTGKLHATARYDGYADSLLEDYRKARTNQYTLLQKDNNAVPANSIFWTFPDVVPMQGDLEPDATKRRRQTIEGPCLLYDALGGLARCEISSDEGSAYI